jgi:tetratricopeptide (TPR) repeat protein
MQGDYTTAEALFQQALEIHRELGIRRGEAECLGNLAYVALEQGEYPVARAWFEQALAANREAEYPKWDAELLLGVAQLAAALRADARAARLWGAAEGLRETIGTPLPPSRRETYERQVSEVRAALGEEAFAGVWAEGRVMSREEAIDYALSPAEAV